MSVIFTVPTSKFVAVMIGKTVAAPIVIVVTVPVSTFVPPVSVVVVFSVIFVVLVFVSKSCVSGKHKKAENDDRKAFSSIQSLLRLKIGQVSRLSWRGDRHNHFGGRCFLSCMRYLLSCITLCILTLL